MDVYLHFYGQTQVLETHLRQLVPLPEDLDWKVIVEGLELSK